MGSDDVGVDDERVDGCLRGRNWFRLSIRALLTPRAGSTILERHHKICISCIKRRNLFAYETQAQTISSCIHP